VHISQKPSIEAQLLHYLANDILGSFSRAATFYRTQQETTKHIHGVQPERSPTTTAKGGKTSERKAGTALGTWEGKGA